MSNNENMPQAALSQEEMEVLAKETIRAQRNNQELPNSIINDENVPTPSVPVPSTEEKLAANPETVRLPSIGDIANVKQEDLTLTKSEMLYENVTVGQPDPNYKPTNRIEDTISPEFASVIKRTEEVQQAVTTQPEAQAKEYEGNGLVIENTKQEEAAEPIMGMSPDTQDRLASYIANMDSDMAETKGLRDTFAEFNPNLQPVNGQATTPEQSETAQSNELLTEKTDTESDRSKKYKEAVVIIDKLEAKNLEFTKEEREKLQTADVIKLNEVRSVDLKQIKRRRERKTDVKKALQVRGNSMKTTNVVLPASGYYAEMLGCSPYEIMTLQNEEDPITDNQVKWKLIYDKIKSNSIGFKSYEEFMSHTAVADYEVFIWGILRSTFEDIDKISLNCMNPECKNRKGDPYSYDHSYSVSQLLRAEEINERINEQIRRVVDARTVDEAKDAHNKAPVNDVLTFQLNESGFVVELCVNNVNDFINKTLENLSDEGLEPQYRQAALIATAIKEIGIEAEDGQWDFFDEPEDITEIVYHLSTNDLVILAHKVQEHTADVSFKFGFIDLECPKCHNHIEFQPMQVETILFYRNALSMNVSVE